MKILFDYETMIIQKIGGVSRYHYELAKRMRKINDVHIPVMFSRNYYFEKYFNKIACKYDNRYLQYILKKMNAVHTFAILMSAYLRGKPYDVVHSTFYNPDYIYPYYKFIDRAHRTKLVITIYDMIQEMEADMRPNMKRSANAKKKALGVADAIISISEKTKEDLLNIYPFLNSAKTQTIYLGCDKSDNDNKKTRVVGTPDKYVLFVGQRVVRKNFLRVQNAMSIIHEMHPDVHLVCTGGGKLTETELSTIKALDLEGFVSCDFYKDEELYSLYANAECFIFPSLYEGFGLPILEAWSRKCPVLLSKTSCFPEIGGDAALYFDGESENEIVDCLTKILENDKLKVELREKGKKRLELFSWDKMASETNDFYKRTIEVQK